MILYYHISYFIFIFSYNFIYLCQCGVPHQGPHMGALPFLTSSTRVPCSTCIRSDLHGHGWEVISHIYSCIVGPALLKLTPLRPRLALLIFVVEAMSGAWLVEQPSLSMLRFHPRIMDTFSFFEEP